MSILKVKSDTAMNIKILLKIFVGLKHGEIYSPQLWSIFIEDLEWYLSSRLAIDLDIHTFTIILLLYADDMVVFVFTIAKRQS